MDIRFDGKTALVTGAGKGIGRGIAKALLDGGAEIYALSRTQADLDTLKQECTGMHTVCVDLTDWDATRKAVQDIGAIDLLVNNADLDLDDLAFTFMDTTPKTLDKSLAVTIKAVFNVSQVVAKGMIDRSQGGCIVNMSSIASGMAYPDIAPHAVSKGGINQLTRVMALELGPHQIRVNAVAPTWTKTPKIMSHMELYADSVARDTERTPLRKIAEVHDIVSPVLYLLSDKSGMINGAILPVDGGFTIC